MTKRRIQYQIFESLSPQGKDLLPEEMKIKLPWVKRDLKI
jgi:hypothetical protein